MPRFCSFGQVIRGGTISGFGVGIGPYTDTMNDTRISRMRIIDSDFFGVGLLGFGNVVEHTLIEGGRHAVFIQGNRNTLQRMTIRDTVGIVAVTLSSDQSELGNVIRDNRIEDTRSTPLYAGEGIWVSGAHNTVARNVVVRSVGDGIVISSFYDEAVKNTVNNNLVDFTGGNGLKFEGREHSLFRNVTRNNAQNGLRVEATSSTLDRNQSFVNFGYGIDDATAGGGTAGTDNTYALNICYTANVLGPSSPAGLCR
jgi:hypothetical protein